MIDRFNHPTTFPSCISSSADPIPSHPKRRPDWAGGGLVSNLVSALIGNKFLYGFMKIGARKVLIDNAEKKGVEVRV
jgi:hypothetical protein